MSPFIVDVPDVTVFGQVGEGLAVGAVTQKFEGVSQDRFGGVLISLTSGHAHSVSKRLKTALRSVFDGLLNVGDMEPVTEVPLEEGCGEKDVFFPKVTADKSPSGLGQETMLSA